MAQVVTNKALVDRNARMGKILTTASLIVILAPLAITFPILLSGKGDLPGNSLLLMYGALIVGLILSNIGGYYMNRWGFKYYDQLEKSLKGTDKKYRLYNYSLPVPNALLTPYGVTVLLLKNLDGRIYANQSGWRMSFDLLRLLRWFSAEQLGNPSRDLQAQIEKLEAFIHDRLGEEFSPPIDGLILFTNPKAVIEVSNVELPIVFVPEKPDSLKEALKKPKGTSLISQQDYNLLYELFEEEAEARRIESERGLVVAGRKLF